MLPQADDPFVYVCATVVGVGMAYKLYLLLELWRRREDTRVRGAPS